MKITDNENSVNSYLSNLDPSTNATKCSTSGLEFFLRILSEVIYKLNCVVACYACWFTMATLSDGIDSQMMLCIIRESKSQQINFHDPGDFLTEVKQINSQSDLISMSNFAGPSYLTVRPSVYIF